MTPGTERIDDLVDWPLLMPCVADTPMFEAMKPIDRERLLLTLVTLAELAQCKQAVERTHLAAR